MKIVAMVLLLCACGDDSMMSPADARVDSAPAIDAPSIDAPPDAIASDGHCVGDGGMGTRHQIFLLFDGVMLTPGTDDSRANHSSLVSSPSTVPPFEANASSRQQLIDDITANVRVMLNGYNVDVVTTRPASGDYWMIVFATASSVGAPGGTAAFAPLNCGPVNIDNVAIVVDMGLGGTETAVDYANLVMFDLGLLIGAGTNQLTGDCLNDMGSGPGLCSLSNGVTQHMGCNPGSSQNEQEIFADQLGCL